MPELKNQPKYQNNPFFIAIEGLGLLFDKARSVAILFIVISSLTLLSPVVQTFYDAQNGLLTETAEQQATREDAQWKNLTSTVDKFETQDWIVIGTIVSLLLLGIIVINVFITGITDYTSSQLAKGKSTTLSEAFKAVLSRFLPYLWLQIIIIVKVFLWSLLLIVPGIIMKVRYSLSGAAFFDKKISPNAATKYSAGATKGAWLTTFASFNLFNFITLGVIQPILQPGIAATLYKQLSFYHDKEVKKPEAHVLSWLTLLLPFIALILVVLIVSSIFALLVLSASTGN